MIYLTGTLQKQLWQFNIVTEAYLSVVISHPALRDRRFVLVCYCVQLQRSVVHV